MFGTPSERMLPTPARLVTPAHQQHQLPCIPQYQQHNCDGKCSHERHHFHGSYTIVRYLLLHGQTMRRDKRAGGPPRPIQHASMCSGSKGDVVVVERLEHTRRDGGAQAPQHGPCRHTPLQRHRVPATEQRAFHEHATVLVSAGRHVV